MFCFLYPWMNSMDELILPLCVCLQDINSLNKQIAQLQDLVRSRGAPGGRHIQSHSNTIVVSLQVFDKSLFLVQ